MNIEDKQMLIDLSKNFIEKKANEIITETEKIVLGMDEEKLLVIFDNLETKMKELNKQINQLKNFK
ncbi:MAG: hypothetical protein L6Q46_05970 [Flavobacterium sp.]|uniref:hypothetical protein n=1 Tax=Flavobacterium sp. TaxID=239 RepID=UPI0025C66FDB|nr:hypothetical protein [Flavobacterium sp.]MCK6607837.1 hypothetical protein [Flavobacterium sp.]